jgi:hypothetical protein
VLKAISGGDWKPPGRARRLSSGLTKTRIGLLDSTPHHMVFDRGSDRVRGRIEATARDRGRCASPLGYM